MVLEHVKSHYREEGLPQDKQAGEVAATVPTIPIQMPFQIMNNLLNGHSNTGTSKTSTQVHNQNLLTIGGGQGQLQVYSNQTPNYNSQNTLTTSTIHDVAKNNNIPGTNSTALKGSFSCGICGQVSNWKHVIQVFTNCSQIHFLDGPI